MGSLFKVKGFPYLLQAFKKVFDKNSKVKLLIVGTGDQEQCLRDEIIRLGLKDNVLLLGFRNDIPELLNLFDIYVCSSISEGLSLSVMEAMSAGKVIISTNVGGNAELIQDGQNGLLVPSKDPDALAEKILFLLNNDSLMRQLSAKAREDAIEFYSLRKMIDTYQNLYEELLS